LLVGAEKVRLVVLVNDLERISSWICILIGNDFVTLNVDIAFDLGLLYTLNLRFNEEKRRNAPLCYCSSGNTSAAL
jgi:hypothetical protein